MNWKTHIKPDANNWSFRFNNQNLVKTKSQLKKTGESVKRKTVPNFVLRRPPEPKDILWFGTNQNKGLGIFSYSDFRFKLLDNHNPELKMIIPIAITGGNFDFTLYAIWANNPNDPDGSYIEQVWKVVLFYDQYLTNKQTMLVGDFNSNTIWDRTYRVGNHSTLVKRLEEKGIYSSYHSFHNQIQGQEQHPTLFMYRHKDKPYHIDYCFASKDLIDKLQSVEVGEYDFWIQYSDHVPVIVTFDLN